jgi:hypothetical protein
MASSAAATDSLIDRTLKELQGDLVEDLLAYGGEDKKKKEKKSVPRKPSASSPYDVYSSFTAYESAAPERSASSIDQALASIVNAKGSADVVSIQLTCAKPYGDVVLVRVVPPPSAPVLKKLGKHLKKELKAPEKFKPSKDFIVLSKKAKKIRKEGSGKKPKKSSSSDPAVVRIKANLDKLKNKKKSKAVVVA